MAETNERLKVARQRLESPLAPGEPMSRQDLAEAVNAHIFRASAGSKHSALDANHVGKWERGTIRWPAAHYRAALRAILDVETDRDLGFVRPTRGKPTNVDRKTFLKTALGAGAGAVLARHAPPADGSAADLLKALSTPTGSYRLMEQTVSGEQLSPVVEAHLGLATGVVVSKLRTATGYCVLSEISGLAAWLAADRGDTAGARCRYAEAVNHAGRAHHPLLASYMTASLGQYAVECGDPRQGLTLLERAAKQLDRSAPPIARAWLASLHAVAHASIGDRAATYRALKSADKAVSRGHNEPVWPWVFVFDRVKATRYEASALARIGDLREATAAFKATIPTVTGAKSKAPMMLDQAQLFVATGNLGDGCALAIDALKIGREFRSERITSRVRAFRAGLPHGAEEVQLLDAALTSLYHEEL